MFMNVDRVQPGLRPGSTADGGCPHEGIAGFQAVTLEDRWILSRFHQVTKDVNEAWQTYRFHEGANRIYDFFWGDFCDWYIELIKSRLAFESAAEKASARIACSNLVSLFEAALRLLHPVMPFITEEIWQAVYDGKAPMKSIALAAYPQADQKQFDLAAETEMAILQDLIVSVRQLRVDLKVENKEKVPILVFAHNRETWNLIEQNRSAVERLANVSSITEVSQSQARQAPARSTARFDVHVVYEKKIDVAAERDRLRKELDQIEREIGNGQRQLNNQQFLAKAPAKVVEGMRARAQELAVLLEKTQSKLDELN
jgi:valyl-tRNA synthetase